MRRGMDEGVKGRVRLWLRSEKALGLKFVPMQMTAPNTRDVKISRKVEPAAQPIRPREEKIASTRTAAPVRDIPGSPAPPPPLEPVLINVPFDAEVLSTTEKRARLIAMDNNEVRGCTRCRLCQSRTNTVFGEGDVDASICFIGEGPGENEDLSGRPFVGRAGQLLDRMIAGMGLKREQVFIVNIVKCRPPNNRVPAPDEVATCTPYLVRQLEIVRPRVIVTLGLPSAKYLLQTNLSMGRLRGHWASWRGIKVMPTYHPAYVLRSYTEETRAAVWSDLKQVMTELKMPVPKRAGVS